MKKIVTFLLLAVFSCFGFGQSIENYVDSLPGRVAGVVIGKAKADDEHKKLGKAEQAYNAEQPSFPFRGSLVEIRLTGEEWDECSSDRRQFLKDDVEKLFTGQGASITWSRQEIERETDDRDYYRDNGEVDQSTLPSRGTIKVARYRAEITFVQPEGRHENLSAWLGRWWKNINIDYGRSTQYAGLIVKITDRHAGTRSWVYKTLVSASTADNVGASLTDGFFGAGFDYDSYGHEEILQIRAQDKALARMKSIFKAKNSSRRVIH